MHVHSGRGNGCSSRTGVHSCLAVSFVCLFVVVVRVGVRAGVCVWRCRKDWRNTLSTWTTTCPVWDCTGRWWPGTRLVSSERCLSRWDTNGCHQLITVVHALGLDEAQGPEVCLILSIPWLFRVFKINRSDWRPIGWKTRWQNKNKKRIERRKSDFRLGWK